MRAHLLYLLKENPIEKTQDGRNRATNKLVARVKYIWLLATQLPVYLRIRYARLNKNVLSLAATKRRLRWIS